MPSAEHLDLCTERGKISDFEVFLVLVILLNAQY